MCIISRLMMFYGVVACFSRCDLVSCYLRRHWSCFHIWDAMIPRRRGGWGWSVCGGYRGTKQFLFDLVFGN
ncbi:hypothetical protein EDB82DRAFT_488208 [Fusarium venenatum]|uniref:uncharacterized protein n=1 Tax=Fusarium venenatum TaxID=56646 RepID=UPI001D51312C|nr:hypothetical protein EDB82DRAFT_488208 [Fusarium venenatum]